MACDVNDEGLQRRLQKNPLDHQTQLIYADWLEENDDPRARRYRMLGEQGVWSFGSRPRMSIVEALRIGRSTMVTLRSHADMCCLDAEQILWRFANWCARCTVEHSGELIEPALAESVYQNERWLNGERGKMLEVGPEWREAPGRANAVCRMAGYSVALSAAKYTSRFAERLGIPQTRLVSQEYELMRLAVGAEAWESAAE